ncbi:DDE-type integrase/transposase/recombinase [Catellatospora citrea]|uniref:DDE-type integrase/transposase/recombinase n=1 Tax=Catellatospora citrea TaxID=53366 RepID=UPI0033FDC279
MRDGENLSRSQVGAARVCRPCCIERSQDPDCRIWSRCCWPTPRESPGARRDRWFVHETYVKVNSVWRHLHRAVDRCGQVMTCSLAPAATPRCTPVLPWGAVDVECDIERGGHGRRRDLPRRVG